MCKKKLSIHTQKYYFFSLLSLIFYKKSHVKNKNQTYRYISGIDRFPKRHYDSLLFFLEFFQKRRNASSGVGLEAFFETERQAAEAASCGSHYNDVRVFLDHLQRENRRGESAHIIREKIDGIWGFFFCTKVSSDAHSLLKTNNTKNAINWKYLWNRKK